MVCLLAGTRFTKSLVLFGGWQAACRLDCYKIQLLQIKPNTVQQEHRQTGLPKYSPLSDGVFGRFCHT
jgi:hypothetical protein